MAEKILMTALSPTMESGTIVKWIKQEGDDIESGDVICEVETDKTTMEYETVQEGKLLKIVVQEGAQAKVGEVIAVIGEEGEDITGLLKNEEPPPKAADPGSQRGGTSASTPASPTEKTSESRPRSSGSRVKVSPVARRLAEEHGIDLSSVSGSGPDGRIVKRDIKNLVSSQEPVEEKLVSAPSAPAPVPPDAERVPISGKRRIIARRLAESKYSAPHYYLKVSVKMDRLIRARSLLNERRESRISMNAFFIKFAAEALKRHPWVNSGWAETEIIRFPSIDIGVAVAQEDGLITPVVRDCGNKGIVQIDEELRVLIDKALNNKLNPEEYTGATFSISNLGSFGIEEFTAIINPPGSAILAIGETRKVPDFAPDGSVVPVNRLILNLSCDHRVVDGAVGGRFLKELKDIMEEPARALF